MSTPPYVTKLDARGGAPCEFCGRVVSTYVPKGGDGSARRVRPHRHEGEKCPGRWAMGWEG